VTGFLVSTTTDDLCSSNLEVSCRPMKPVAPAMTTFMMMLSSSRT
jgi:hypothetical protein